MSIDDFKKNMPSVEELRKNGLKILVVIVNRTDGEKTTKLLRNKHFILQFTCMAQGTQGSDILNLFGLDSINKAVVLCLAPGFRLKAELMEIAEGLNLKKPGKGIAFTIPLDGISLPKIPPEKFHLSEHLHENIKNMETEVDKMNNDITHSIILAVINQGNSEELVKTAKASGAKGGTVINARRTGIEDAVKFFGITLQAEKEIVAILTERDSKQAIMDAIDESFGMQSPAHGIILSVPVDGIVGVEK